MKNGTMTQIIWQDGYTEGKDLFDAANASIKAGSSWQPKTIDVPGVLVDKDTIDQFLKDHPAAMS